jgi:hypothetical protein
LSHLTAQRGTLKSDRTATTDREESTISGTNQKPKRTPAQLSAPIAVEPVAVPLWPDAGQALNLKRGTTYNCAKAGTIPVRQYGKALRVPLEWLRAQAKADDREPEPAE